MADEEFKFRDRVHLIARPTQVGTVTGLLVGWSYVLWDDRATRYYPLNHTALHVNTELQKVSPVEDLAHCLGSENAK